MSSNYYEYMDMIDTLFYDRSPRTLYTNYRLSSEYEKIYKYLTDNAKYIFDILPIEFKEVFDDFLNKTKVRFFTIGKENRELTLDEVISIGMFLKGGIYYEKLYPKENKN